MNLLSLVRPVGVNVKCPNGMVGLYAFVRQFFYTLTSFIKDSKEYKAGLLPDASSIVLKRSFSNNILVNLAALAAGMPLCVVNLLFLNTGFVNTKSNALTLHLEERISEKIFLFFRQATLVGMKGSTSNRFVSHFPTNLRDTVTRHERVHHKTVCLSLFELL